MKQIIVILILIVISVLAWPLYVGQKMTDAKWLESKIKNSKNIESTQYEVPAFTEQQIESMIAPLELVHQKNKAKDVLQKKTKKSMFFSMSQDGLVYVISYKESPLGAFCRLAVMPNKSFIGQAIKSLGGHAKTEHSIDKRICNGLYGYGKASL